MTDRSEKVDVPLFFDPRSALVLLVNGPWKGDHVKISYDHACYGRLVLKRRISAVRRVTTPSGVTVEDWDVAEDRYIVVWHDFVGWVAFNYGTTEIRSG